MQKTKVIVSTKDNLVLKKMIIPFVVLTTYFSWMIWWALIIAMKCEVLTYGSPLMMMFHGVAIVVPAIISIVLILRSKQIKRKELFRKIFNLKQPVWLYVLVVLIDLLMYLVPLIMNRATIIGPFYLVILLLPIELIGGGLEEIGWRFLLQPALEKKTSFIVATLITGCIWAVWHLPLFFMEGTNQYSWNFGLFTILVIGMAFILATIYRISKSVVCCMLFHTLFNALGDAIALDMDRVTTVIISSGLILLSFIILKIPTFNQCKK